MSKPLQMQGLGRSSFGLQTDGQCSNHCVPAFKQAFGRCGSVGAVNSADRQLVHCVPPAGSKTASIEVAQWVEHQASNLTVTGSTPV